MKIVSAAALLVVVAAGCGGAARPQESVAQGVPQALAHEWEGQASEIAAAAAAGNDCRAMHLAASLRDEVAAYRHKLPVRLRSPLLTGVNALADRISTCTRVVVLPAPPPKGAKPKPHKQDHGPHGQGNQGDGGNGQ